MTWSARRSLPSPDDPKTEYEVNCGRPPPHSLRAEGRTSRDRRSNDREPPPGRVRRFAAAGLRDLRGALLSRSEPADAIFAELAYRGHRRQADGSAPGQDP